MGMAVQTYEMAGHPSPKLWQEEASSLSFFNQPSRLVATPPNLKKPATSRLSAYTNFNKRPYQRPLYTRRWRSKQLSILVSGVQIDEAVFAAITVVKRRTKVEFYIFTINRILA